MKYTKEMFKRDFPNYDMEIFKRMKFRYAIAGVNMKAWDGDYDTNDHYQFTMARVGNIAGGGRSFISGMNCSCDIKKNEVFVVAIASNNILCSAIRTTGIMTNPIVNTNYKMKNGNDRRITSFLSKKKFKKQQPIWDWYNDEIWAIQKEQQVQTQELNDNFYYLDNYFEKPKNKYLFKAMNKKNKTSYGVDNNCYDSDFSVDFDFSASRTYKNIVEVKMKIGNAAEFCDALFPLYEVAYNGHKYLFEKGDFSLIENKEINNIEVEYVNKWEDNLLFLEKKRKAVTRWRDRAFKGISNDVYSSFPEYKKQ